MGQDFSGPDRALNDILTEQHSPISWVYVVTVPLSSQLWLELVQITDLKIQEEKIAEYNLRTTGLWDALMELEMQLVDQLEVDVVK